MVMPRFRDTPTEDEIKKRAALVRKDSLNAKQKTHRAGKHWAKGDVAWVKDLNGEHYVATLIGDPYKCDTGPARVMVSDIDGEWEVKVENLSLERPDGYKPSTIKLNRFRSNVMPSAVKKGVKKAKAKAQVEKKAEKKAELCRCGCGEMCKPGSRFRPGHDARYHSRLKKLAAGTLTMADLKKEIQPYAIKFYTNPNQ